VDPPAITAAAATVAGVVNTFASSSAVTGGSNGFKSSAGAQIAALASLGAEGTLFQRSTSNISSTGMPSVLQLNLQDSQCPLDVLAAVNAALAAAALRNRLLH